MALTFSCAFRRRKWAVESHGELRRGRVNSLYLCPYMFVWLSVNLCFDQHICGWIRRLYTNMEEGHFSQGDFSLHAFTFGFFSEIQCEDRADCGDSLNRGLQFPSDCRYNLQHQTQLVGYKDVVVHVSLLQVVHDGVFGDLWQEDHVVHAALLDILTLPVVLCLNRRGEEDSVSNDVLQ